MLRDDQLAGGFAADFLNADARGALLEDE